MHGLSKPLWKYIQLCLARYETAEESIQRCKEVFLKAANQLTFLLSELSHDKPSEDADMVFLYQLLYLFSEDWEEHDFLPYVEQANTYLS